MADRAGCTRTRLLPLGRTHTHLLPPVGRADCHLLPPDITHFIAGDLPGSKLDEGARSTSVTDQKHETEGHKSEPSVFSWFVLSSAEFQAGLIPGAETCSVRR
jgi:hypothetical protein